MSKLFPLVSLFLSLLLGACGCPKTELMLDPKLLKQARDQDWNEEGRKAVARRFLVGPQRFSEPELQAVLRQLEMPPEKWTPTDSSKDRRPTYHFQEGSRRATYSEARSELVLTDTAVESLLPEDVSRNPDWRQTLESRFKLAVPALASTFDFINPEEVTRRDSQDTEPSLAYIYGRHLRERDGRLVLGTSSQVRQGLGRGLKPKHFIFTNVAMKETTTTEVPTRKAILDDLSRFAEKKGSLGRMIFPYSPDSLFIEKLIVHKIFKSYLMKPGRAHSDTGSNYLEPAITVYAEAKVQECDKKKECLPRPTPLMLHFNFPCLQGVGQCLPKFKP